MGIILLFLVQISFVMPILFLPSIPLNAPSFVPFLLALLHSRFLFF